MGLPCQISWSFTSQRPRRATEAKAGRMPRQTEDDPATVDAASTYHGLATRHSSSYSVRPAHTGMNTRHLLTQVFPQLLHTGTATHMKLRFPALSIRVTWCSWWFRHQGSTPGDSAPGKGPHTVFRLTVRLRTSEPPSTSTRLSCHAHTWESCNITVGETGLAFSLPNIMGKWQSWTSDPFTWNRFHWINQQVCKAAK